MTREQELEQFIKDAAAFVDYVLGELGVGPTANKLIVETLAHDLRGLRDREECLTPRVTGYAEKGAK